MQTGKMNCDVRLLGTSLHLKKGEIVKLTAATNLSNTDLWFARPRKRRANFPEQDSILISPWEVTLGLPRALASRVKPRP